MSRAKGNTYLQVVIQQLERLARLLCLDGMCETGVGLQDGSPSLTTIAGF